MTWKDMFPPAGQKERFRPDGCLVCGERLATSDRLLAPLGHTWRCRHCNTRLHLRPVVRIAVCGASVLAAGALAIHPGLVTVIILVVLIVIYLALIIPTPLRPSAGHCRNCGHSLDGLAPENELVTCPECGEAM